MSPVTGLARLPGQILLSVHMGNFSPVDRDEIQETKPKYHKCIVRDCRSFVDSCNFTNKANMHTFEVEIHRLQKVCHAKAKLFCQKSFVPVTGLECSYGKIFIPVISVAKTEISVTGPAR